MAAMFETVIREIDAHIARLQQARAALSGTTTTGKRRGRPPASVSLSASGSSAKKRGKRRGMSPEGRARIAAAQKARWAKIKGGK